MGKTVTFRLDPDTAQTLDKLVQHSQSSKSGVIKEALHARWKEISHNSRPTSWEIYSGLYRKLGPAPPALPRRHRARQSSKLIRERLLAKRREGTL